MDKIICKRLRGLMVEHDITLYDLSKRLSISEKSLSLKINGRRGWMYWELISIVRQFGLSEVKEVFPEFYNHILEAG